LRVLPEKRQIIALTGKPKKESVKIVQVYKKRERETLSRREKLDKKVPIWYHELLYSPIVGALSP
jgi:hypothetical protein